MKKNSSETDSKIPTKSKISFLSAIFVVIGSSIGAGIFFKSKGVLEGAGGNLALAIVTWIIAAIAIICMALSLIEVASNGKDNLSIIGWNKKFNKSFIFKSAKNFMCLIYIPLTYFFMPLYFLVQMQEAIGVWTHSSNSTEIFPFQFGFANWDWAIWGVISIFIVLYFVIVSGLSSKAGSIQNWIITFFKFIPLVAVILIGIIYASENNPVTTINEDNYLTTANQMPPTLSALSPGFGIFIAIAGIFFAYDGFYFASGMQTEMKNPKKTPIAIFVGLLIVTIIYLLIAITMSLNGTGDFKTFGTWLKNKGLDWLYGVINILIAIGILGIINGFSMWTPRFLEDLIRERELPLKEKYRKILNPNRPVIGILYTLAISIPLIILFVLIGSFGYIDTVGYGPSYGNKMGALYSFADLMANWTALFAFMIIVFSIFGCLRNRKTKEIITNQKKFFKFTAIISIILITIPLIIIVIDPFYNLIILFWIKDVTSDQIISAVMLVITLFLFLILIIIPTITEMKKMKRGVKISIKNNNFNYF
ncbi:MAG: APC family permease [Metamycoplasmataceae bacterium]